MRRVLLATGLLPRLTQFYHLPPPAWEEMPLREVLAHVEYMTRCMTAD